MHLLFKKFHLQKLIFGFICMASLVFVMASASNAEAGSFWLELKHAWYDIFTPDDYYRPIVNEELDVSVKGLTKKFEFKHKYDRAYDAGIMLKNYGVNNNDHYKSLTKRYKPTLKLEIKFYVDNVLVLSKVSEEPSPFLGLYGDGMMLIYYRCPDDLPLNKQIVCEVKVIEPDKYLQDNYGPASFYIAKMSDK